MSAMSETFPSRMSADTVRKGHYFAQKRVADFTELFASGRWKRYYKNERDFVALMRQAEKLRDDWKRLATSR